MRLVIINGSSCSGKSTVVKSLLKKDHSFHLSYDAIKWQFSNYVSGKYREDILELLLAMGEKMFDLKYDVITDTGLFKELRDKLKGSALSRGYKVVEINLEAAYDVLSRRFDERVAALAANPKLRMANTSKERFKEMYDWYQADKSADAITIHTDTTTPEELEERVASLL